MQQPSWSPTQRLSQLLPLGIMLVFCWQGVVTLRLHEPWRDEVQAWLIARDADLPTLFRLRQFEARPAVWDLMLVPLAKAGVPIWSAQLFHLGLAATSLGLVLWRSPLPGFLKLAFAFSYFPFWEYAIVMRIYAACVLWMFCLAVLYPVRFQSPFWFAGFVALLFNTSVHAGFVAGAVTLLFGLEAWQSHRQRRVWLAWACMVLAALACAGQVWMAPNHPHLAGGSFQKPFDYTQILRAVSNTFLSGWDTTVISVLLGVAGFGVMGLSFLQRWPLLLITLANMGGQFLILGTLGGGIRHYGLIPMGLLFCLWIAPCYDSAWPRWTEFQWPGGISRQTSLWLASLVLGMSFLASVPVSIQWHAIDRQLDYSGGVRMAEYLKSHQLDRCVIAAFPSAPSLSVLPHLPHLRLWYPGIQGFGTYVHQDLVRERGEATTVEEVVRLVRQRFSREEPLLLLLNRPLEASQVADCELLYRVDSSVFGSDERLYLYRLRHPSGAP